jgi:putative ABC transport system permease protein
MIRHIFKLLWNERKTNVLIVLEFVLIFCILWFCCDYLWFIGNRYFEPRGFDIEHTYQLSMGTKPGSALTEEQIELSKDEHAGVLMLIERVKRYPGIEAVGLSNAGMPYSQSYINYSYSVDTTAQHRGGARLKYVSSDYFDVFKIDLTRGKRFDWSDPGQVDQVIVVPDYKNEFVNYPVDRLHAFHSSGLLRQDKQAVPDLTVIGATPKIKMEDFEPYGNAVFQSIQKNKGDYFQEVTFQEVTVRVAPEADRDFPERFTREMRDQLNIGSKYLQAVIPLSQIRKERNQEDYNTLNGVFSVTGFLVVNIFLGVLGTFWLRTQSRRAEIGLRMALGASRRKVQGLLVGETIGLLAVAALVGTIVCLNIGQTDLLSAIGVPAIDREKYGIGAEQDAINFALTFAFLAAVSVLAVWYPARQAAKTQPAEVLHEE